MDSKCRSCWWQEGGRCYQEPVDRLPDGRSKRLAEGPCPGKGYHNKRKMLERAIPGDKLVILSEEREKLSHKDVAVPHKSDAEE